MIVVTNDYTSATSLVFFNFWPIAILTSTFHMAIIHTMKSHLQASLKGACPESRKSNFLSTGFMLLWVQYFGSSSFHRGEAIFDEILILYRHSIRFVRSVLFAMIFIPDSDAGATIYYVAPSGNDIAAGTNWITAKKTIQSGVDLAVDGDTVLVSNGVYDVGTRVTPGFALSNRVVITNNILVRSVNGPAVTIIKGINNGQSPTSARGVFITVGTLSGFTITNGFAPGVFPNQNENNMGGGVFANGGSLTNCVISGNSAPGSYGGGAANGTFYNCVFSGNHAGTGGGAYGVTLYDCTLSGNSASESGGGTYSATLTRCVVSDNTANHTSGGVWGGSIYNTLIKSNTAGVIVGGASFAELINCTVVGNYALNVGGVGFCDVRNSIVYFNTDTNGISNYTDSGFNYSCSTPLPWTGLDNINNNPAFISGNNYRPASSSPCIDQGRNSYATDSTVDLDGNPRIIKTVDIGAYEYQFNGGYWAWASGITNGMTNLTQTATGDGYQNLLKFSTGSSPTNSDILARLSVAVTNGMNGVKFNRNTNASDVTIFVEATCDVSNNTTWAGIATNRYGSWGGALNVIEIPMTNLPRVVVVQDPVTNELSRAIRLRVTRP